MIDLVFDAFKRMKFLNKRLMPVKCPFYGFNKIVLILEGVITLSITLRAEPEHLNLMIDSLVVKVPSVYNAIVKRPSMKMA